MVSEGPLKMKTFCLNAKCSVTDIIYPVKSLLTLKMSIQKLNGVGTSLVAQWSNAGDTGLGPGLGRSHMSQSN